MRAAVLLSPAWHRFWPLRSPPVSVASAQRRAAPTARIPLAAWDALVRTPTKVGETAQKRRFETLESSQLSELAAPDWLVSEGRPLVRARAMLPEAGASASSAAACDFPAIAPIFRTHQTHDLIRGYRLHRVNKNWHPPKSASASRLA